MTTYRLLIAIEHALPNWPLVDFRKKSAVLRKNSPSISILTLSPTNVHSKIIQQVNESSSPGEFHPQALTDPDVTVSRHPALIIQLLSPATLPYPLAPPISG
jgi:hypothetical protein